MSFPALPTSWWGRESGAAPPLWLDSAQLPCSYRHHCLSAPPPPPRLLPRSSFKPSFCITTLSLSGKQQHPAPLAAWSRHGEVMCGVLGRTPCTATAGPGSTRACFCVTVEIVSKKPPAFDGKLLVDVLLPVLCGDREDYYSDLWMQGWGPWMWVHGWMVASCPPSQ